MLALAFQNQMHDPGQSTCIKGRVNLNPHSFLLVPSERGQFALGCPHIPYFNGLVHTPRGNHAIVVLAPVRAQHLWVCPISVRDM